MSCPHGNWGECDACAEIDRYSAAMVAEDKRANAAEIQRDTALARVAALEGALTTANQALLEVQHAQDVGPNWYTKGENGLRRIVAHHVREGLAAIAAVSTKVPE